MTSPGDKTVIGFDDPGAAVFRENIRGWVSRDGLFFGDDPESEYLARSRGCTHKPCQACGQPAEKAYQRCPECREAMETQAWEAMETREWDGKALLCVHRGDQYFSDPESAVESLTESGVAPEDMRLVICEPMHLPEIDARDYVENFLDGDSEFDGDLPPGVLEGFQILNTRIRESRSGMPLAWQPGGYRLDLRPYFDAWDRDAREHEDEL
jgi:RNA polymerase subunit RPABC4/transcription elongation factor Spt4